MKFRCTSCQEVYDCSVVLNKRAIVICPHCNMTNKLIPSGTVLVPYKERKTFLQKLKYFVFGI